MMWPLRCFICGVLPLRLLLIAVVLDSPDGVIAQETGELDFEVRTYNGTNNNLNYPLWGSVNITQIRAVASANYSDGVSSVSGSDRPTAREVTTEVFLAASSVRSSRSALFVGWGLLVSYDLFLNADDETLSFDIPCDDGHKTVDVWCPEGAGSEAIEFFRSQAEVSGVRNPLNLATSYLDLDFMYGRSKAEAEALRTMESGFMNLTEDDMPVQYDNGTWLLGDQRTAVFPVTFALHIILLREHNICCETIAPDLGYEEDEDIYQVCRAWTIAIFEQITNNEFNVRLTGTDIVSEYTPFDDIVSSSYDTTSSSSESTDNTTSTSNDTISSTGSSTMAPSTSDQRDLRRLYELYSGEINPGADVFATTVGVAALYAAIPPTVRIMKEGYDPADEDGLELTEAAEDIAGLFERNSVENIIRGAVFSSTLSMDAHFSSVVSTTSPLFKLPVDAIQRGRDHGVPTYNDAREAYGLSRATSFADVTEDTNVQALLEDAYGGDIGRLDALTGALAEGSNMSSDAVLGDLLQEVWKDQLYRTLVGDRLYQSGDAITTDAENQTLLNLIERTTNVTDLPLSVFTVPEIAVCYDNCSASVWSSVYLSDEFKVAWYIQDNYEYIAYTLSAKYIGGEGFMGIGFGGDEMVDADDFIICEVLSSTSAECTDRQSVSSHTKPDEDTENSSLFVEEVTVDGDWTSVTFYRHSSDLDDEDYNLYDDLDGETATLVIFAHRAGEGIQRHASTDRGASSVNFVTGSYSTVCDEDAEFYLVHGALILSAWLFLLPLGIFFARYRKGEKAFLGSQWWEMHAELMIIASEIVLPMGITAIVATSGSHDSYHAKWGFYMITAIGLQILTGFLRQRALEGKHSNFCLLHRVNKHVHIWFGHIAFLAGAIQCYRGVELVSATDSLHFSAMEDLVEFQIGNFGVVYDYVMPTWFGVIGVLFLFFETRKQLGRYKKKGAAMICCVYELANKKFVAEGREVDGDNAEAEHHPLMPRTRALPLYTMDEFNHKVLNGMTWVIVDGAILDVGNFSRRHPGGARVIMNGLGTDITSRMEGEDLSVGSAMSFTPHDHSETAWELARSLVIGYIDDEDSDSESGGDEDAGGNTDYRPGATSIEQSQLTSRHGSVTVHEQAASIGLGSTVSGVGRQGQYEKNQIKPSNKESAMRAAMIARAWGEKARRKGSVNAVPLTPTQTSLVPVAAEAFLKNIERNKDRGHFVLQRFHVCPFVLRQRMDRGEEEDRAVYRYVFKCPGEAAILAQTATGVCYFNMRVVRSNGDSMVQRSYNATAVRVIRQVAPGDASSIESVPTTDHHGKEAVQPSVKAGDTATLEDGTTAGVTTATGRPSDTSANAPGIQDDTITNVGDNGGRNKDHIGFGGKNAGGSTTEGAVRVVPAVESREGLLCVEMRIRLYKDGAMSKLLNQLPNDSTNATVQLQGPFLADSATPPPAHRNVIMIAAGTGINPMVQLIRDYQSFDSQDTLRTTGRSRLALLWQATTASDLYCLEELSGLKARGRDLLEITTLVSGNHRKTNKPKAPTARQGRRMRRAVAAAAKVAAARGIRRDPSNSSSRPSSSGFLSRMFSGSPVPSRSQSIDGDAVENELPMSTPTSYGARDTSISHPKVSGATPVSSGGGAYGVMEDAYGVMEDEGLDNLFIDSPFEEVGVDRKTPSGTHSSGPYGARTSAVPLGVLNEEGVVGKAGQDKRHQGSSARTSRDRAPVPLGEMKGAAPEEPNLEESLTSSSSNFALAKGITSRPRELPQPSREHIRGKYFSPHRVGIITPPRTGKVSKEILREVFGEGLTQSINGFNERYSATLGSSQQAVERSGRDIALATMCGTKTESGKLQVVLSGPSGFVFQVEHMLEEMGVPEEALLILD